MFQKLDRFLFSGEWGTPTLLGPLERINFNHWTVHVSITNQVLKHCVLYFLGYRTMSKECKCSFGLSMERYSKSAWNITSG
jgi:hypothetical protein